MLTFNKIRFLEALLMVMLALTWSRNISLCSHHMHTWQAIVFIKPGVEDMSIIVCAFMVLVD